MTYSEQKFPEDSDNSQIFPGFRDLGLNEADPSDQVIAQFSEMLGHTMPDQIEKMAHFFEKLQDEWPSVHAILIHEMVKTGDDGLAIEILGLPEIVNNLQPIPGNDDAFYYGMTLASLTAAQVFMQTRLRTVDQARETTAVSVRADQLAEVAAADPELLVKDPIRVSYDAATGNFIADLEPQPEISMDRFDEIELDQLQGDRAIIVALGGGSDIVQATLMAEMLRKAGKECAGLISIRGSARVVEGQGGEIADGVYEATPNTTLPGTRYFEDLAAATGHKTLLIFNHPGAYDFALQMEQAIGHFEDADMIIGIDTGGDVLYPRAETENVVESVASPDQDQLSLEAILATTGMNRYVAIFGTGIDTPPNAQQILEDAQAKVHRLNSDSRAKMVEWYETNGLPSASNARFAKTLPVVRAAIDQNIIGLFESPLPRERVLDPRQPWNPFTHVQEVAGHILIMDADNLARAVGIERK